MIHTAQQPEAGPPAARLLVCGFGAFPGFPQNPAAVVTERLQRQGWAPQTAAPAYRVLPTTWAGSVDKARAAMGETDADGVLLLGVAAGAEGFRVEMRARNCAATAKPDAEGVLHHEGRIAPLGPPIVHCTAPVEPMVEALVAEGLPAHASSDAGDYLCNYVFYRLLVESRGRPVAFLHLPPTLELDDLERGVKAVTTAFARSLTSAPAHTSTQTATPRSARWKQA